MTTHRLNRLPLRADLLDILQTHKIYTASDFFSKSHVDLINCLDVRESVVTSLTSCIADAIAPEFQLASSLKCQRQSSIRLFIPTMLAPLDLALHGGIPFGSITEISGRGGVGKTNMVSLLSVIATAPLSVGGCNSSALFIDTENAFSPARFFEIARSKFPLSEAEISEMGERLKVVSVSSSADLLSTLGQVENMIVNQKINLIIIDSLASIIRSEFGPDTAVMRSAVLNQLTSSLKFLGETFSLAIIVTNQITTVFRLANVHENWIGKSNIEHDRGSYDSPISDAKRSRKDASSSCENQVIPALGNTWSHCVNTRIYLDEVSDVKRLRVLKSPICPAIELYYAIGSEGPFLIAND